LAKTTKIKSNSPTQQRFTRFKPDPLTVAYIDLKTTGSFSPSIVALVINESYMGCALILTSDLPLKKLSIRIKVGELGILKASIIWVKNLEENIHKVGIKFQE